MKAGRLEIWKSERGFGFVRADGDHNRTFVHITAFAAAGIEGEPEIGSRWKFEIGTGRDGRTCVTKIEALSAREADYQAALDQRDGDAA